MVYIGTDLKVQKIVFQSSADYMLSWKHVKSVRPHVQWSQLRNSAAVIKIVAVCSRCYFGLLFYICFFPLFCNSRWSVLVPRRRRFIYILQLVFTTISVSQSTYITKTKPAHNYSFGVISTLQQQHHFYQQTLRAIDDKDVFEVLIFIFVDLGDFLQRDSCCNSNTVCYFRKGWCYFKRFMFAMFFTMFTAQPFTCLYFTCFSCLQNLIMQTFVNSKISEGTKQFGQFYSNVSRMTHLFSDEKAFFDCQYCTLLVLQAYEKGKKVNLPGKLSKRM